jgi:hypothetical protein
MNSIMQYMSRGWRFEFYKNQLNTYTVCARNGTVELITDAFENESFFLLVQRICDLCDEQESRIPPWGSSDARDAWSAETKAAIKPMQEPKVCKWKFVIDDDNYFKTACRKTRKTYYFMEGTLKDNNYNFCPKCGGKIEVV